MRLFPIWYTLCKMHFNKKSYTLMYYLAKWVQRTYGCYLLLPQVKLTAYYYWVSSQTDSSPSQMRFGQKRRVYKSNPKTEIKPKRLFQEFLPQHDQSVTRPLNWLKWSYPVKEPEYHHRYVKKSLSVRYGVAGSVTRDDVFTRVQIFLGT